MDPRVLERAIVGTWGRPLARPPDTYGASQAGFCLEKMLLGVTRPTTVHWKMLVGKVMHEQLPRLVALTPYATAHGRRFWQRPVYEVVAAHDDPAGFFVRGHVDVDFPAPALDRVVEAKFTFSERSFERGDVVTEAYIEQANAYATMRGRGHWELWIVHLTFDDLAAGGFVSVIEGETEPAAWDEFLARLATVHAAVTGGTDVVGPEAEWECKWCSHVYACPYWRADLANTRAALPLSLREVDAAGLRRGFDIMRHKRHVKYDQSARAWRVVDEK
jgi:hypothetical protein